MNVRQGYATRVLSKIKKSGRDPPDGFNGG
jgi:hypothetical protein